MKLADIAQGTWESGIEDGKVAKRFGLAYARVSTDDQERAGLSIPALIREIKAYAAQHGIDLIDIYQEAESAFSDESRRPEFWRMVGHAMHDKSISRYFQYYC